MQGIGRWKSRRSTSVVLAAALLMAAVGLFTYARSPLVDTVSLRLLVLPALPPPASTPTSSSAASLPLGLVADRRTSYQAASRPDVATPPLKVLVWGLARGGSSVSGEIFNKLVRPATFYWFEPLTALRLFLFGENWFLRDSVAPLSAQLERAIVPAQIDALRRILYDCDFASLPPDLFTNQHLYMVRTAFYYSPCLQLSLDVVRCRPILDSLRNSTDLAISFYQLVLQQLSSGGWFPHAFFTSNSIFESYVACLGTERLQQCQHHVRNVCLKSQIRSVKVIDTQTSVIQLFKQLYPQTNIIQVVRDPRAVAYSRCGVYWLGANCTSESVLAETAIELCRKMNADLAVNCSQFVLFYEEFVVDPLAVLTRLFRWLARNAGAAGLVHTVDIRALVAEIFPALPIAFTDNPWDTVRHKPDRNARAFRDAFRAGAGRLVLADPHCSAVLHFLKQLFAQF